MDTVDASAHYAQSEDDKPSLLVLILDTNPFAWAQLSQTLPLDRALSAVLVFLNAHMAFSHANRVAVIASHTQRAKFLYPRAEGGGGRVGVGGTGIGGGDGAGSGTSGGAKGGGNPMRDANKYRQFRIVEDQVQAAMRALMRETTVGELEAARETMMAGALSLALSYVNRVTRVDDGSDVAAGRTSSGGGGLGGTAVDGERSSMNARILVVSVSGDLAEQYVPIMNSIFAAQRKRIPIDICKVAGETVFLQQASDATRGIYMQLSNPESLLQYLMMCFIPDNATRRHIVPPTQINVDFRAACFCHKRVVDVGFVCSVCLSIFCSPPDGAVCTTCNTKLDISAHGNLGGRPAVVPTKKKKTKKQKQPRPSNLSNEASATSTPVTPAA